MFEARLSSTHPVGLRIPGSPIIFLEDVLQDLRQTAKWSRGHWAETLPDFARLLLFLD